MLFKYFHEGEEYEYGWVCWHEAYWDKEEGKMDWDTIWSEKPEEAKGCIRIKKNKKVEANKLS